MIAGAASAVLAATGLAACSSASAGTGPVTLNYYLYPDTSGATQQAINNCDKASGGKYTIPISRCLRAQTASGSSWSAGWPHATTRSTSWVST
jgi:multiple sugar transport system substrate-binding protein